MATKIYDFLIIGSGIAGYAAAIYATRFNLKTIIIGKSSGGMIAQTHIVENYPGFISLSGMALAEKLRAHAAAYNVTINSDEVVVIKKIGKLFSIKTAKEKTYYAKTILFATGTRWKKLNVPGEKEFTNKGVSYCATCDGPLFKNKIVGVVGGSDSAAKESLLLSEYAKKVYIIYRGQKIRAEPINIDRLKRAKNIEIITNTNVTSIQGKQFVERIKLDKAYLNKNELNLNGLFIEIGHVPESSLAKQLCVKLNKNSEIKTDRYSKTNVDGIYAAGDVTDTLYKQAILSASAGVTAAHSAYEYLKK